LSLLEKVSTKPRTKDEKTEKHKNRYEMTTWANKQVGGWVGVQGPFSTSPKIKAQKKR
jgi:hypothetical protein